MDNNLKRITTWSKSKQANIISDIVSKYPTAKEFKDAVLKSGDSDSISLVQNMNENMPREQYINYLQYIFVKHSNTGKILANSLVGLGLGAGLAYLASKEVSRRARNKQIGKETGINYNALKDEYDVANLDVNKVKNSPLIKSATQVAQALHNSPMIKGSYGDKLATQLNSLLSNPVENAEKIKDLLTTIDAKQLGNNGIEILRNFRSDFNNNGSKNILQLGKELYKSGVPGVQSVGRIVDASDNGKIAGGLAGGIGGAAAGSGISNMIQNWNSKKQQEKIDSLKYNG